MPDLLSVNACAAGTTSPMNTRPKFTSSVEAAVGIDCSPVDRNLTVVRLIHEHRPDVLRMVDEWIAVVLVVVEDHLIAPPLERIRGPRQSAIR